MNNRQSDGQDPNPSPPSQQGMNREEAILQQRQQLYASRGGDRGAPNPRDVGGSSMNMPPSFQHEQMMRMGPDLRYLQEMRRNNEEMIMAANRRGASPGGGIRSSAAYFASSSPRNNTPRYPEGLSHRLSPDGGRDGSDPYGGGSSELLARRGLVMPPQAAAPGSNPYMLLSLLQREQQRLAHVHNTNHLGGESWLPASKRQRLPPHMAGMDPAWAAIPQHSHPQGMHFASSIQPEPKQRKRHVKSFPMKLMETINEHYDENVIAWLPDGKSFVVVDPDLFVETVLSQTFKGGKYSSFVRKLNRWGFSRLISGTGMDCFHNPLFQRDRPDFCALITSNPERNDAVGIDPSLLGGKPSLAGIEKYFEKKGKEPPTVKRASQEEGHDEGEEDDEDDDRKPAAEEPSESSNAAGGDAEEPTNVESV